ncbi:MAG: CoA transferase [Gammaproteobacteria bacterium]|nr:CoA transferase [Gammaproteobacteria bacterium]MBT4492075.1 CoA transferase [Gammaproteobacteria bacterium]
MAYLLDGIKVVDLASFLAGPGAATLMADYGAEVIKIEPPGGDGYRRLHGGWDIDYNWQLTSRNKRGISVDVKTGEGRDVLLKLLEDADVLITNFRNDQMEDLGLGWDELHQKFRKLIVAQLTGYGNVGPDRKRRGYDTTAWFARTGIMELAKKPGEAPPFPAGGVGDHASAMSLFAGIMMALYKRDREGKGSFVETSLVATGCWANGMQLQGAISGYDIAQALEKAGERSPFAMVYTTRDDRHICLVLTNPEKEFQEIAEALGHKDWSLEDRFSGIRSIMRHRDEIRDLFRKTIAGISLKDLCLALDEHHLTYGVVEGLMEVVNDAHLIENGVIVRTESEDPRFQWTIANPIKISDEETRSAIDPPVLGEETREILAEHGFTADDIERLVTDKIVFAAENSEQE